MAANNNLAVSWFDTRKGKLTYSMYGSRNGTDGTADCSGSTTQAIKDSGGSQYAYLYSTVTLSSYLSQNGYTRISANQSWDAQRGDVVLMSWGPSMAYSSGAGGHVGVMKDASVFISVDYWTGGQAGTAVSEHDWNYYYSVQKPAYIEVWRLTGSQPAPQPQPTPKPQPQPKPQPASAIQQFKNVGDKYIVSHSFNVSQVTQHNGIWQLLSSDLLGGSLDGANWSDNGIPLDCITFVNNDGSRHANQTWNGSQSRFVFDGDYNHGTIDEYDFPTNAVGIIFGSYGMVWFNADAWLNG